MILKTQGITFNKLCFSTCWPIPSIIRGWLYSWSDPKERISLRSNNLSFCYKDDVLSLNNPNLGIWYIASTPKNWSYWILQRLWSQPYLDLHLEIDGKGKLLTKLNDKSDDFVFRKHIVYFPVICGNIPSAPAYRVFMSQLLRFARVCWNNILC